MNVLLLNPPKFKKRILSTDPILTRCTGIPSKAPYLWPPIGLAYIAGYIGNVAHVKILDAQAEGLNEESIVKKCNDSDLVIVNVGTTTIDRDLELSKIIKQNNDTKIGLIGTHATYFHRELIKNDFIDFIIRGEPERIVYNLIKNFNNPKKVKGITWKNNGKTIVSKNEELIQNLDELPFAARHLLPNNKYYDIIAKKFPITQMITSRGCPFNCTFCSANLYNGKKYRYRSAENIIKELEKIVEEGFKDISIFDDTFTTNKKRVIEIANGIKDFEISWRCLSRVDTVDKEMLEKMYDSGCYQILLGVESGDQRILDLMKKGTSVEQARKAFKWCDEIGIETVGFFILGYPGETEKTIKKTIDLANELHPDFVSFNALTPLPGSEIYEILKPQGNWEEFDFSSRSFCDIPSKELQNIIAKGYRNYYLRLSYFFGRIKKTKEPARIAKQNILFWLKRSGVLWEFLKK